MNRNRLAYVAGGSIVGLLLMGLGWGFGNFYLVVAGTVVIAAAVAGLTIPMPAIF
jgi:hypothetical protein